MGDTPWDFRPRDDEAVWIGKKSNHVFVFLYAPFLYIFYVTQPFRGFFVLDWVGLWL